MSKVIKVSDEFHKYLKERADYEKRTIIATLDIIQEELVRFRDPTIALGPVPESVAICDEHHCPLQDCSSMIHKRLP